MNTYEITFIVRPDLDDDASRAVVDTVTQRIETAGGEIIAALPWNPPRRRMAYTIKDFGDGFYVTTTFRLDGQRLREIEQTLRLNDRILRFLVVAASPNQVALAEQRLALSQAAPAPSPEAASRPAEPVAVAPAPEAAIAAPESVEPVAEPVAESTAAPSDAADTTTEVLPLDGDTIPITEATEETAEPVASGTNPAGTEE